MKTEQILKLIIVIVVVIGLAYAGKKSLDQWSLETNKIELRLAAIDDQLELETDRAEFSN